MPIECPRKYVGHGAAPANHVHLVSSDRCAGSRALPAREPAGYAARMSDIFYDAASIDYPILDADAHVNDHIPDTLP